MIAVEPQPTVLLGLRDVIDARQTRQTREAVAKLQNKELWLER